MGSGTVTISKKACWSWYSVQMTESLSSDPIILRVGWKEKSFPFTCNKKWGQWDWSKPRTLKEDWKLSWVSWDPDQGLNYKTPPIFFPLPKATFVRIPVPKLLCNCSVTLSTAELLCTAPGSKDLVPPVVIQPFAGSNPDIPIPTAQPFTFPCRYEQRVLIPGEIRPCKTNRGKGKVSNGTRLFSRAVKSCLAWPVLADSTSSSNSCPDSWSCLGFYQLGSLTLCSDPNDQVAFTAATTSY